MAAQLARRPQRRPWLAAAGLLLGCGLQHAASGTAGAPALVWVEDEGVWGQDGGSGPLRRQLQARDGSISDEWAPSWLPYAAAAAAEEVCGRDGRSLISLHSANASAALAGLVFEEGSVNAPVWLGLVWSNVTSGWRWNDQSELDYWAGREGAEWSAPAPLADGSGCVVGTATSESALRWDVVSCDTRNRYVCGGVLEIDSSGSWSSELDLFSSRVSLDSCITADGDSNPLSLLCPAEDLVLFVDGPPPPELDPEDEGAVEVVTAEHGLAAFQRLCDDPEDESRFQVCTNSPLCPELGGPVNISGPQCPCNCDANATRTAICVRLLRELKSQPSCLFVALYGGMYGAPVTRDLANAIIERDSLFCPEVAAQQAVSEADTAQQTERSLQIWYLMYVFGAILIGEITRTAVIRVAIPPSMFLILEGILIGYYVEGDHPGVRGISLLEPVNAINPFMLFYIFLPGLAFEASYNMNIHMLKRSFTQIMTLSLPGVTMGTLMLGVAVHEFIPACSGWSWQSSFLLGCILVATDTVGQQRFFMDSDQPSLKKLGTLIDGECQLDSDFAIILFWALLNFDRAGMDEIGQSLTTVSVVDSDGNLQIIQGQDTFKDFLVSFGANLTGVIGGGFAWGILFCIGSYAWMYRRTHDTTGEATFSLSMSFLACLCAELYHQSGLIAILTVGLFMNYHGIRLGRELVTEMKRFWDIIVHIVESLLFITCGMVCYVRNHNVDLNWKDWISIFLLYIVIHIVRCVVVFICGGLVSKVGYGLTFKEGQVMVWGGLTRGAVSLGLALVLASRPTRDPAQEKMNALAVLFASIMTFLTVFVNGGTVKAVVYKLGLVYTTPAKQYAVKTAWARISHDTKHMMEAISSDSMYGDVDWDQVRAAVALPDASSFYTSDPWEDMEAMTDLFLSPLGWVQNLVARLTCSQTSSKRVSIFGMVSKALTSEEEVTGVSADGERSSERLHPMQLSDYTSAVARNKHVFNKLRSAQFRVETRKRMIQMELNSYLEQYDEGFLGRSAVMMLMHELEHQSDHHKVLEADDVIHLITPDCLRHGLYSWQLEGTWGMIFKFFGFGVIRNLCVGTILNSMTTGWDACEAFCRAKLDVSAQLDDMVSVSAEMVESLKDDIAQQVQAVKKAQCVATAKYPDVMRGVKTKKITKQLLTKTMNLIQEQHEEQMLDKEDLKKLTDTINMRMDEVFNVSWKSFVQFEEDITMEGVLDSLAWVQSLTTAKGGKPGAREKLYRLATEKKRGPAENLLLKNERSRHILIVITGFAEIVDSTGNVCMYCGAGSMIGDVSVLTAKPSLFDVRSVTDVTVCELEAEALLSLMDEERSLEHSLWKMCGYRIAKRFLLPNDDLQDDMEAMMNEGGGSEASSGAKNDETMRDVRAFLMDASVVRVDEGEDIQIDEFAVLLHTDDVNNNGYPKCPTMLGRTTMRAVKRSYIFMHVDKAAARAVLEEVPDNLQDMIASSEDKHTRAHRGLHEHGASHEPGTTVTSVLGRGGGDRARRSPTLSEIANSPREEIMDNPLKGAPAFSPGAAAMDVEDGGRDDVMET